MKSSTTPPTSDDDSDSFAPLVKWMIAAFIAWLIWWGLVAACAGDREEQGQLGDLFGGINALFTAFAFAGVIFTAHLQRKELKLQRKELEDTRGVLAKSAEAQEASVRALALQAAIQFASMRFEHKKTTIDILKWRRDLQLRSMNDPNSFEKADSTAKEMDAILTDLGRRFPELASVTSP
jgi:hypothetical protein